MEWGKYRIYFFAASIALSSLNYGLNLSIMDSPVLVFQQCVVLKEDLLFSSCFPVTSEQWSWVISIFCLGAIVGVISAFNLAKFKSKSILLANDLIFLIGHLTLSLANSPATLIFARFIIGVACGIATTINSNYLVEISSPENRGSITSFIPTATVLGVVLGQLLGYFLAYNYLWRIMFGICAFPSFIQIIVLPLFQDRLKDSRIIDSDSIGDTEIVSIELKKQSSDPGFLSNRRTSLEVSEQNSIEASLNPTELSITQLLTLKTARKSLLIGAALFVMMQFSGTFGLVYFSTKIFSDNGNEAAAKLISIGLGLTGLLFVIISQKIVDSVSRRSILILSNCAMIIDGICITLCLYFKQSFPSVVFIYIYLALYSIGIGSVAWVIHGDIFPAEARSSASCLIITLNWIALFIVLFCFQAILDTFGVFFIIPFLVISALGTIMAYFIVPETKGHPSKFIE